MLASETRADICGEPVGIRYASVWSRRGSLVSAQIVHWPVSQPPEANSTAART
jgi:hypothetical protein